MNRKILLLLAVSGFVIGLDQASKLYIHTHFQLSETFPIWQDFFAFTYVRNYGAAFGFMAGAPENIRHFFFLSMPPLALIFILAILRTVEPEDKFQTLALSFIFGGAIGNYIDRIRFGYVIDFLDFHYYHHYSYPAFNVADISIIGGVMGLILLMIADIPNAMKSSDDSDEETR